MLTEHELTPKEKRAYCVKLFEKLFEQHQAPVTIQQFRDFFTRENSDIYSSGTITFVVRVMLEKGQIVEVYRKEGSSLPHIYIPRFKTDIPIPYQNREWETLGERRAKNKKVYAKSKAKTEEDYQFFLYMIGSPHALKKTTKQPLKPAIRKQDEDYYRFVDLIEPYVELLDQKNRDALISYVGLNGSERKSMKQIAEEKGIQPSLISNHIRSALSHIGRFLKETIESPERTKN